MIVPGSENLYSDDSEDGAVEIDIYVRKYQLLLERCEVLQQDNERLVNRIQQVKKLLRRYRRERLFLMDRLDQHGDNWRSIPLPVELDEPIDLPFTQPVAKPKVISTPAPVTEKAPTSSRGKGQQAGAGGSVPKRKAPKTPADPNAPKRPANPFFQFCQEQRTPVLESLVAQGLGEPSKQEVTKQLAVRWNALSTGEKKIYYDMYEKSKERYAVDMQLYSLNKASKP
ncbi:TCF3 fusion partner homolog [Homalodisca vitripennis]|uniref:HMG box domain-containing protein n=1 Tax=Homalodisca liturata TaxID=320908 RepID=A0A1B6J6F2_9HEMI|nr:TCF3 fusion partner homolog [Homalodisca vitripennis]